MLFHDFSDHAQCGSAAAGEGAVPDSVVRGLIDHIDGLDGFPTLLDGKFRVKRTTRSDQALLKYNVSEVYGMSSERYFGSHWRSARSH